MESQGVPLPLVVHGDQYQAPVHISAGGTNYTTTLATLTSLKDSKLGKLFNGTLPITLDPINHHYFLDTDGSVFAHTLNFLRYGELVLPDDFSQRPLLLKQARQLEIEPLVEALSLSEEEKGEDESEMSEAEDKTTSNKKTRSRRRRSKIVNDVKEETDNLLSRLGEEVQGFVAKMKQKEKEIQEVVEHMCNQMKKLDDTLLTLRVVNDNRVETTNKENDKTMQEDEKMDKLMEGLGDIMERLMVDNRSSIEKIIKLQDHRQNEKGRQEDEQMCNLMKKLDDTLQTLRVNTDDRVENTNKENDKTMKEDEKMDKLMKGLGDIMERLLVDNRSSIEKIIKLQDHRQNDKGRQEDERMCNLRVDNFSRLQNTNKENDKGMKEVEKMVKLMKGIGDTLERLTADNGSNLEQIIVMQGKRQKEEKKQRDQWMNELMDKLDVLIRKIQNAK